MNAYRRALAAPTYHGRRVNAKNETRKFSSSFIRAVSNIRAMTGYQIKVEDKPAPQDIQLLFRNLNEYNFAKTGQRGQFISVFVRDDEGQIIGGAQGWTAFEWLHIDVLWLKESLRGKGVGRQLMEATEAEAKRRGCKYAKLETFSFQAPEFYKRNGYTVFAELDEIAGEHHWYFMKKNLS